MRISTQERQAIVSSILKYDSLAKIYLYGSRVADHLKGGDIDLLVISETLSFSDKVKILMDIKGLMGEQKIDLSIAGAKVANVDPFYAKVLKDAICLNVP